MSNSILIDRLVNRSTLQLFDDLTGIPQAFEEVESHIETRLQEASTHHARRALTYLENAGYIEQCQVSAVDKPLWKITALGTRMIRKLVPRGELDLMLFEGN